MFEAIFVLGMGTLLLTALIGLWMTRPKLAIVPEEERLVIYRFGKFARVAGPGRVWVRRRIDQIERKLNVREQPHYLKFNGLYAYDIPVGYTLSLWYKLDPLAAANGDQHMLRKFAQFDSRECEENIRIRIHDLFIKYIAEVMQRQPLPQKPTVLDKLIPFCPGQDACDAMINKLRNELPEVLRSFGAVWNPNQPIAIKDFHLGSSIVQLLERDRIMENFQQRMPYGDHDLLTQATIALEGVPTHAMNKIVVEQNGRQNHRQYYGQDALPAKHREVPQDMQQDTPKHTQPNRQQGAGRHISTEETQLLDAVLIDQLATEAAVWSAKSPQPIAGHRNIPLSNGTLRNGTLIQSQN